MIYDPKRRQYIERGHALTAKEVRDHVESLIQSEQSEVDRESKKVLFGITSLAAFFEWMREKIRTWHSIAGVIAYGGQGQMNLERWKRINEKIQSELGFLDKWQIEAERGRRLTEALALHAGTLAEKEASVPSGLEAVVEREVQSAIMASDAASRTVAVREAVTSTLADSIETKEAERIAAEVVNNVLESQRLEGLIWGSLSSRGQQYVDATYKTFANSEKSRANDEGAIGVKRFDSDDEAECDDCPGLTTDGYVAMDEVTDIGENSVCGSRCRCWFEFSYLNIEPLTIDREIYA